MPRPASADKPRRLTIAQIAELANVSPSAVSFALNGRPGVSPETRERILEVVRQANWRPNYAAQALSRSRAGVIGVVTIREPHQPLWSASFGGHFLAGVQSEIAEHGVLLILHTVENLADEAALYERWLGERRVDGVLVINPQVADPRLDELDRIGLPAVVVGDTRGRSDLSCVWTDDEAAAALAVQHLADLGHEHVARIGGDPHLLHFAIREAAFLEAARKARVEMHAETMRADPFAAEAVRRLSTQRHNPLTAVIVEDLEFAVHLTGALRQAGISVPGDVSVLAWDDGPAATLLTPALTALHRDITRYGRLAAKQLIEVISSGSREAVAGTQTHLVPRESTGAARTSDTAPAADRSAPTAE
ncbi:LacI family transcriptional regulator [Tessaracoccus sp. OS52]|uniref:LacI family DNA-binding transcriptional regulator n=1 Tax=Tessaracoccus sp. OS52 TaxID=2886691 RepID=UPI001D1003CF|nr:LacI family DNA-binding transcriptional regulator [Tessaracoccus sp. OS52]MCC2594367.1 LacI family transcriptional regulator [Tessaracoccus sp. OS52]